KNALRGRECGGRGGGLEGALNQRGSGRGRPPSGTKRAIKVAAAKPPPKFAIIPRMSKKILIVEDDASARHSVELALQGAGHRVPPSELLLWVEALLKRLSFGEDEGDVLKAGDCEIDLKAHLVKFKDVQIANLTGKEFDLLYFLVKKRPKVYSRKQILSQLWHT